MHLSKTAARKTGRTYELADVNLLELDNRRYDPPNCGWTGQVDNLEIEVRGEPQTGSKYDYEISFSAKEIIHFLEMAVEDRASNTYEEALGMGALTVINRLIKNSS